MISLLSVHRDSNGIQNLISNTVNWRMIFFGHPVVSSSDKMNKLYLIKRYANMPKLTDISSLLQVCLQLHLHMKFIHRNTYVFISSTYN